VLDPPVSFHPSRSPLLPKLRAAIIFDVSKRNIEVFPQLLTRFHGRQMDREINLDSILALEKQIEEHQGHEKTIIRLKRARNSLLNVSTFLPPEILGSIFRWNVIRDGDFGGLPKDSHNFLLVCHHWFEVASCTLELWSFWGNTVQDWARQHDRFETAPLDLVLEKHPSCDLDDNLRNALQDRAARNLVRRVHIRGIEAVGFLNSVISSLVTEGEGTQSNDVESFIVDNFDGSPVDVSAFFSRYRLPKLQCLRLMGCTISSWDVVRSYTMALTTLELRDIRKSPILSLPQLLSILSSNPLLQNLVLSPSSVPDVNVSDGPSPQVPLRHLKRLRLNSDFCPALGLLNQLQLPDKMDNLRMSLYGCSHSDISHLGHFLGDLVQRRGFPGGGLELLAYPGVSFDLNVGDTHKGYDSADAVWFVEVSGSMNVELEDEAADQLCFDLISHIPLEQVTSLQTRLPILRSEELCVGMRNLIYLHLGGTDLSTWFVEPEILGHHTLEDFLPRLARIVLIEPYLSGGDWSPLANFLSRRAAVGNRISSLKLSSGHLQMDEGVVESIECVVKVVDLGHRQTV